MGESEVRSPNSLAIDQYHPRRGESPGSKSSPSNARVDGGHVAHDIGKGGPRPASAARREATSPWLAGGARLTIRAIE